MKAMKKMAKASKAAARKPGDDQEIDEATMKVSSHTSNRKT
jgi:hypothetical protein